MKKIILFLILSVNLCLSQKIDTTLYIDSISKKLDYNILNHNYYLNYFSNKNNVSLFVLYELNPSKIKNNNFYSIFINDPLINTSLVKYYKNSKYDRGHLFNAEDASYDKQAFLSSYLITNATPQVPNFNRGIWKRLEKFIHIQAKTDSLVIITGSDLYNEDLSKLSNVISIPKYFFKVVINLSKNKTDIYYIENKPNYGGKLSDYLVSKKLFETYTGIYLSGKY